MQIKHYSIVLWSSVSILLALLILVLNLTQASNIQIIPLQRLYWTLDKSGGMGRSITNISVILVASVCAIYSSRKINIIQNIREFGFLLFLSVLGLTLGLAYHYAYACCESPVLIYLGFPFSWLQGVTRSGHQLTSPVFEYLFTQSDQITWKVILWGWIKDVIFWLNVGLLFLSFFKLNRTSNGRVVM